MPKLESHYNLHTTTFFFPFTLFTFFCESIKQPVESPSQKITSQNRAEAKLDCNDCLFIMYLNNDVLS